MAFNIMDLQRPMPAQVTCGNLCRSVAHYIQVVQQFNVATNPRYQPRDGNTYCNAFSWDVTRAFAAEIPHWVVGHELNANALVDWLAAEGPSYGWLPKEEFVAKSRAAIGCPTVVTYKNPTGHGHIAIVLPNGNIAQAGGTCFYDRPLVSGFGHLPVQFWSNS